MFRRTLQPLDAGAFDDLAGAWAQQATMPGPGQRRVIAVDGKTLRGSASGAEPGHHMLAALDHAYGAALAQVEVGAKTNEIPMFPILLDRIEITGAVITADTDMRECLAVGIRSMPRRTASLVRAITD
jgi:hypothetical protein